MLNFLTAWRAQGYLIPKNLTIGTSSQPFLPPTQHRSSGDVAAQPSSSTSSRRGSCSSRNNSPRRDWASNLPKGSAAAYRVAGGGYIHENPWVERSKFASPLPRRFGEEHLPATSREWIKEKPRSWDNLLSTKSFGGYGYGYGFIDTGPLKEAAQTNRVRSSSNYQLEKQEKTWPEVGSRTIPRPKIKQSYKNDSLVSPLNSSSCFSCDCLSIDPLPLEACLFANPKSSESLIAPRALIAAPSDTCLVGRDDRRRSRTTSLVDCLGGSRKDMAHLWK